MCEDILQYIYMYILVCTCTCTCMHTVHVCVCVVCVGVHGKSKYDVFLITERPTTQAAHNSTDQYPLMIV